MIAYFYAGINEGGEAAPQGVAALRVSCVQRGPTDLGKLERAKGFEPSTPTLATLRLVAVKGLILHTIRRLPSQGPRFFPRDIYRQGAPRGWRQP